MEKRAVGRILSALLVALLWLFAGARVVLDLIGYSTVPEDVDVARTRLDQILDFIVSGPWWALPLVALLATLWLIWVSWPRNSVAQPPNIGVSGKHEAPSSPQIISPLETYFSKKVIRVADLIHGQNYVVGDKVFEDCALYGPGVISFMTEKPQRVEKCSFVGDNESLYIVVEENRTIIGAVGFQGCTFLRSEFLGLGIIGTKAMIDRIRSGMH